MAYRVNKTYERTEAIILAFDIGTTHSAVSFSHAYPGDSPSVRPVVKWPGQPEASGDSKIPTIIAYQDGQAKFFGAEARELDEEEYEIARWFKLRLHPESMKVEPSHNGFDELEVPPLPRGVSLFQVYTDFIQYIYRVAKDFFVNNTPNGLQIWNRLESRIPIIFCIPNGWDMSQNALLTDASIKSGIVTTANAEDRLWFITEGEASVHYALAHTNTAEWLREGTIFAVTDAGGSTVDSTLYRCHSERPLLLEEVCASVCVQAGGVFVDRAMENVLKNRLAESNYGDPETIAIIIRQFEQKTKRIFDGHQFSNVISFGTPRDNDKERNIVKGKISLGREEVSQAYTDVIVRITDSCRELLGSQPVQHLLLVGGFGESPYLKSQLRQTFGQRGTQVVTIEEPSKKAAVDGAVIWYLTQLVEGRAARFDYGIYSGEAFDSNLHGEKRDKCFTSDAGYPSVWLFRVLIPKNTRLDKNWRVTWSTSQLLSTPPTISILGTTKLIVYAWQGNGPVPFVLDPDYRKQPPGLRRNFQVEADLSALVNAGQSGINPNTRSPYWCFNFNLDIVFENLRLKARLRWIERGIERIGPATLIPASKV